MYYFLKDMKMNIVLESCREVEVNLNVLLVDGGSLLVQKGRRDRESGGQGEAGPTSPWRVMRRPPPLPPEPAPAKAARLSRRSAFMYRGPSSLSLLSDAWFLASQIRHVQLEVQRLPTVGDGGEPALPLGPLGGLLQRQNREEQGLERDM